LRFLFEYRNHYTDNLSITETYLAENNYEEALATLANMYNQFEVAEEQVMELNGLEIYAHWLQQLENEEKSIYALSERELDYLVNYVKINTGRGKVFANNILCALYNICIEDEVGGEQYTVSGNDDEMINPRESVSSASSACSKNLENITLYPNPTTGELEIRNYELRINSIEVFDVYGRIVSSHHLPPHTSNIPPSPSSSHQKINISHINSGIYFVKITTDSGEVVKKVVKQ
ncbi:MAG: T9SS type A sorting domain-containing protein, partial [Lentimicrobiaceae bacterium]|nr:T9SS type A sorting domain-containing protein [Lentimicrobiaceae bacterium]